MIKKVAFTLSVLTLASPIFNNGLTAEASELESTNPGIEQQVEVSDREYIENALRSNGLSEDTIDSLLNKLDNGELWDSLKGVNPISEQTTTNENGVSKTIRTYADGSITITEVGGGAVTEVVENSDGNMISPASVTGGTVTSGSGYRIVRGATVKDSNIVITMSYRVDYEQWSGGRGKINRVYLPSVKVVPGSFSNVKFGSISTTQKYLQADVSVGAMGWTGSKIARLYVQLDSNGYPYSVFDA